jgi:uncharacterized membrane protein YedE/YeeE
MQIDWLHFTPVSALIGGILLGAASALLFLNSGRILGITGILEGLLSPAPHDTSWRLRFMLGLLLAPPVAKLFFSPEWLTAAKIEASFATVVLAGVLVGAGTRMGTGCTSGHGICGLARLSARSLVATLCFMFSGLATVFVMRHVM